MSARCRSAESAFPAAGALCALSLPLLLTVRMRSLGSGDAERPGPGNARRHLLDGLRYIRRHQLIGSLVAADAICELGLIGILDVGMVLLNAERGRGSSGFGWIVAASAQEQRPAPRCSRSPVGCPVPEPAHLQRDHQSQAHHRAFSQLACLARVDATPWTTTVRTRWRPAAGRRLDDHPLCGDTDRRDTHIDPGKQHILDPHNPHIWAIPTRNVPALGP
ncbi:hypothetical protein ACIQB5_32670 [Streptomyces sp. NPDC088560]|uniref:hypothetical protein n=1 Tax=Streptomyces sp. NPDC088560 TaxID=3365868 RepID=UPI0038227484